MIKELCVIGHPSKLGGTLFPKRKDDDGNYLPNKGWHKCSKDNKDK